MLQLRYVAGVSSTFVRGLCTYCSFCDTQPECPVCHIGISIDLDGPAIEIGEEKKVKRQGILGRLDIDVSRVLVAI